MLALVPVRDLRQRSASRSPVCMELAREQDQIARAATGDPAAIRAIIVRHAGPLNALAYRMLQSSEDAEDIVQETFLRAWKALPGWRAEAKFSTWLHAVALNLCRDRLRKRRETAMAEPPDVVDPAPGPHVALDQRQRAGVLYRALDTLPDRQREAILLCTLGNYSNREAADMMDISPEAVESLLARGRRSLREILADGPLGKDNDR